MDLFIRNFVTTVIIVASPDISATAHLFCYTNKALRSQYMLKLFAYWTRHWLWQSKPCGTSWLSGLCMYDYCCINCILLFLPWDRWSITDTVQGNLLRRMTDQLLQTHCASFHWVCNRKWDLQFYSLQPFLLPLLILSLLVLWRQGYFVFLSILHSVFQSASKIELTNIETKG